MTLPPISGNIDKFYTPSSESRKPGPGIAIHGDKIYQNGKEILLNGATSNAFRYSWDQLGYKSVSDVIATLDKVKQWGGNTINLYLDLTQTAKHQADLDQVIQWATQNNMNVSLNPTPGKINNDPKDYDDIESTDFLSLMPTLAARYKDTPNILYGTYAEPHGAGEEDIRNLANKVIPQIRKANPQAPIIFSGINGRDTSFLEKKPLGFDNILYDYHDYPFSDATMEKDARGVPFDWNSNNYAGVQGKAPILQGEFGKYWGEDFGSPADLQFIQGKLDEAKKKNQSVFGYALDEPGGLGLLENGQPTAKGKLFASHFSQPPPAPIVMPSPTFPPPPPMAGQSAQLSQLPPITGGMSL